MKERIAEISGSSDVLIEGNLLYDIQSTSCLILGNWGGLVKNLTLQNNIFYSPATGFVLYIHYADSVRLYNNVFWKSRYGGLALGRDVTNLHAYNNIMQSINLNHAGIGFDPENHHFDYNIIAQKNQGMPLQEHDIFVLDPGFSGIPPADDPQTFTGVTAGMFSLLPYSPAIDAAFVDDYTPITDYYDSARVDYPDVDNSGAGKESFYDMGPIEFSGPPGQMVLKPVISPSPGEYDTAISVKLSTPTEGARIHYTLDGSYPTILSTLYEVPFEIVSNTKVQARAFKEGLYESPVLRAEYRFSKDLVPPYFKGLVVADKNTLRLIFNEPVEETSATDLANYSIEGVSITSAALEPDLSTVILTVSDLESDREYILQVANIRDRAETPLTMETDSIGFVYSLSIYDDFENGGRLNWTPKTPSRWSLENDGDRGTYHINTTDYSQNGDMPGEYALLEDFEFTDFVMEVTARQPEYDNSSNAFADYGVIIGYTDPENFYYFLANKDAGSNELFRVTNGVRYSILNLNTSIIPDDGYHTLVIEAVDGYFYVWLEDGDNDWEVEEDLPRGKVGLCSFNDEVYFDAFKITPVVKESTYTRRTDKTNDHPDLHIYPNPAGDHVTLIIPDAIQASTVFIFDMFGRMTRIPVSSNVVRIRTDAFSAGMYIVQLACEQGSITERLLIHSSIQ
ncbi:MAG: chitobiase/beta-hexosaminidase C-terminal domain-containing protein [Bacteroidales bacterium]